MSYPKTTSLDRKDPITGEQIQYQQPNVESKHIPAKVVGGQVWEKESCYSARRGYVTPGW